MKQAYRFKFSFEKFYITFILLGILVAEVLRQD